MVPKMLAMKRAPVIEKKQTTTTCQSDSGLVSFPIKIRMAVYKLVKYLVVNFY